MRVLLVNPPNDPGLAGNANDGCYPPLGLLSLGTALLSALKDRVEVSICDGQVTSLETIIADVAGAAFDVVGVGLYNTNIRSALRVIEVAKGSGASTVVGGDHAIAHSDTLMDGVPALDFVCVSDIGEDCLIPLVKCLTEGASVESSVPWLVWRDRAARVRRARAACKQDNEPRVSLDRLQPVDRTLLPRENWAHYLNRFRKLHHMNPVAKLAKGVTTVNGARGCCRANRRCSYCGIADLTLRGSSAASFWADVALAAQQVNATHFYEVFDSATSWPALIQDWLTHRPAALSDMRFKMYAQAAEITEKTVRLMKDLGVFCVNMGLDSGDTHALRLLKGPRDSVEQNRYALQVLSDAGIDVYASFVLFGMGSEDRTLRALDKTVAFVDWAAANTRLVSIDCALFYPERMSPIGRILWDPEFLRTIPAEWGWDFFQSETVEKISRKWRGVVEIEPAQLCDDFAEICGASGATLRSYIGVLKNLANSHQINFGHSQGGVDP